MEGNACQQWLILFTSFGGGTGQAQGLPLPSVEWAAVAPLLAG